MMEGLGVEALKEKALLQLWMMPKHKPWKYCEHMKDSAQVGKLLKSMYTCSSLVSKYAPEKLCGI